MMNRQDVLERLKNQGPIIAPSLLKCDFGNLRAEMAALESAGACLVHWDVMDGHFVPNLSYGAPIIASVRSSTDMIFDAHLMMEEPGRYLNDFLDAGCDSITVHYEAVDEPRSLLQSIREAGRVAGLAINPGTPVEAVVPFLPDCDMVLVMSVEPGFGGQSFMRIALEKLRHLREHSGSPVLSVDGGIGPKTIGQSAKAGATLFVVGSAIFGRDDYPAAIKELTAQARRGT